jgi:hypothetical protein
MFRSLVVSSQFFKKKVVCDTMTEPIDFQEIILNLFYKISIEVGLPYEKECPTPSETSAICAKIEGKLGIPNVSQGSEGAHKALYNFLKGNAHSAKPIWPGKLAFLLHHLQNFPNKDVDVALEYSKHLYGSFWEVYKANYIKRLFKN